MEVTRWGLRKGKADGERQVLRVTALGTRTMDGEDRRDAEDCGCDVSSLDVGMSGPVLSFVPLV